MVVYEKNMDYLFTIDFSGKRCSVELEETVRTCWNGIFIIVNRCEPKDEHLLKAPC